MTAALDVCRKLGLQECAAYNDVPEAFREITVCMEQALDPPSRVSQ